MPKDQGSFCGVPIEEWPRLFQVHGGDGRALPVADFPLLRALRGERVRRDLVTPNATRSDPDVHTLDDGPGRSESIRAFVLALEALEKIAQAGEGSTEALRSRLESGTRTLLDGRQLGQHEVDTPSVFLADAGHLRALIVENAHLHDAIGRQFKFQ